MSKKIFFPGEKIAIEEEYSSGKNTFEEDGLIKSNIVGEINLDNENREANINGKNLEVIKRGDIVYGKISTVKENSAVVELLKSENKRVICNTRAQLPVRNVSKEFVEKISDFYKVGDFIKAKVSNVDKYSVDIETNQTGLGVINAYCSKCKTPLKFNGEKMMCIECGNVETRKWFEKEDIAKERPRREFDRNRQNNFGENRKFDRNRTNNRGFGQNRNNNKFSGRKDFRGGRR